MSDENHSSELGSKVRSDEISARPDDTDNNFITKSSVHFSLEDIEEDVNFAKSVNG
jgi:hypothetical protein